MAETTNKTLTLEMLEAAIKDFEREFPTVLIDVRENAYVEANKLYLLDRKEPNALSLPGEKYPRYTLFAKSNTLAKLSPDLHLGLNTVPQSFIDAFTKVANEQKLAGNRPAD